MEGFRDVSLADSAISIHSLHVDHADDQLVHLSQHQASAATTEPFPRLPSPPPAYLPGFKHFFLDGAGDPPATTRNGPAYMSGAVDASDVEKAAQPGFVVVESTNTFKDINTISIGLTS